MNDTSITNSEDIANAFNYYLSNIGQALRLKIQSDNNDYLSYNNVLNLPTKKHLFQYSIQLLTNLGPEWYAEHDGVLRFSNFVLGFP